MCERHFRPQDILTPELLVNGVSEKVKSLAPYSLPIPVKELRVVESSVNLPISLTNKSSSSELMEIESPETSKCISLTGKSVTHDSNSDNSTNTSKRIIMNVKNTDNFKRKKNRSIFEISKRLKLPSIFWKMEHFNAQNATGFYQRDTSGVTVKKVHFYNSFVPVIQIYGKKYEFKMHISRKKELRRLLERIDSIEKCYGRDGFVFENCIGYIEDSSPYVYMCSACRDLVTIPDLQRMKAVIESKSKTIRNLEEKVSLMNDLKSLNKTLVI